MYSKEARRNQTFLLTYFLARAHHLHEEPSNLSAPLFHEPGHVAVTHSQCVYMTLKKIELLG